MDQARLSYKKLRSIIVLPFRRDIRGRILAGVHDRAVSIPDRRHRRLCWRAARPRAILPGGSAQPGHGLCHHHSPRTRSRKLSHRHPRAPYQLDGYVARDGQEVEANCVYVLPPNASLTIKDGALRLHPVEPSRPERSAVDVFFSSLAEDCGEYAVGIVLSGSGSDGVLGIKAIKEHAGLVLAQSSDGTTPLLAACRKAPSQPA